MLEVLFDTLMDGIKLLPFLFVTYFIMEYLEHKTSQKAKTVITKSGRFGPLLGGALGIVPQCGFSAASASLYAGKIITLGTLIAIFLSTSDEMIPILISEAAPLPIILKILLVKFIIGVIAGFVIDFIIRIIKKEKTQDSHAIHALCKQEHCHCENSILMSSIKHTLSIFVFILIISLLFNGMIYFIGEDTLANFVQNKPILGPMFASLIGLIPNCASSVILTKLFLSNVIGVSTMIAGLLTGAGAGVLILFRVNKNWKENLSILFILYSIGVISGILLELIGLSNFI